jgi:hypothetical protein
MTKLLIAIMILFSCNSFCQEADVTAAETVITPQDLKNLPGDWTGTLTYLDYSSGKPYSMPANLNVVLGKNDREFILRHTYPKEPKANGKDRIILSKDGRQLNKKNVKSKTVSESGELRIITEYQGKDNNEAARIRSTYILGELQFIIRKEALFDASKDWIMRNEYSYSK